MVFLISCQEKQHTRGQAHILTKEGGFGKKYVNAPQTEAELEAIRRCLRRGSPYGSAVWTEQTAKQLGLQSTLRARGRPRKESA